MENEQEDLDENENDPMNDDEDDDDIEQQIVNITNKKNDRGEIVNQNNEAILVINND